MRRPIVRSLVVSLAVSVLVVGCAGGPSGSGATSTPDGAKAESPAASSPAAASPLGSAVASPAAASSPDLTQDAADIDIGGRTLHLFCMGTAPEGTPTVLAESGLTGDSRTWNDQFYAIGARTRICAYDRAGLNQSQPAPEASRTTRDQVDDLDALIAAADLTGPFVLVGHSIGAWNIALFANEHPDAVAGVVLADPRGPGVSAGWLAALPKQQADEGEAIRLNRDDLMVFETDPSLNDEHLDLRASAKQTTAAVDADGPLFGDRPLIVLRAGQSPLDWSDLPDDLRQTFTDIWFDGQQALADESTVGKVVEVPDAGHDLPGMRPDAVTEAIDEVLVAAAGR